MNEGLKTGIFAGIAAVALGLALWSRPASISSERDLESEIVGKPVFANFEDPSVASSFQIVKYDEALGQLERFEVARDSSSKMWRLPSFDDYPADAAEQVRDATTPLIGLTVLDIQSFDRGDHALYGVLNPDDESLTVAETGVGMLVRVKDDKDQVVASLIIGKEVEQAEGQRFARVPTEDAVYVVEIDTAPFTTDFTKWIKGEVLGVRSFDISDVSLRDYAVLPTQRGLTLQRNFDADLQYDAATSKWSLAKMVSYETGAAQEVSLGEDEELQIQALNDLRNSVQDLQIVDVRRKPNGLATDLKADKSLLENEESLQSLYKQGFFPQEMPTGVEVFATGGETIVGTKDGVKYLLRFGESTASLSGADDDSEDGIGGLRRYLLVTAQLDESRFPPPELKPVPETVEEMLAAERAESVEIGVAAPTEQTSTTEETTTGTTTPPETDTPAVGETSASDPAVEEPATGPEPNSPDPNPTGADQPPMLEPSAEAGTAEPSVEPTPAVTPEQTPEKTGVSSDPEGEENSAGDAPSASSSEDELNQCGPSQDQDQETSQEPATEAAAETDTPAPAATTAPATTAPTTEPAEPTGQEAAPQPPAESAEELQERLEFTREQITKENQRMLDERKEKLDQATKRVQSLNARFADWYYVVSDSVYQKLTLSKDKLIKSKSEATAVQPPPPGPSLPDGFPNFQP